MAFSGPRLAVTNCTAESWWLFLANSPTFGNNAAESWWLSVAFSSQVLVVTNRTAESW